MKINLIIFGFLVTLLMPLGLAFEFDNVKTYDPVTKTVTFKNSFLGIPTSEIATARLVTPQNYFVIPGRDVKVAEIEINLIADDYTDFFKQIDFINLKNKLKTSRSINYKYKVMEDYEVDVIDYKTNCKIEHNKTTDLDDNICTQDVVGSHKETRQRETWVNLEKLDLVKGKIDIGLFTDVNSRDHVEWVPYLFGLKIDEWASWEDSFNIGLVGFYKLDETTGTIALDNIYGDNATYNNNPTLNVPAKNKTGMLTSGSNLEGASKTTMGKGISDSNPYSVSLWFNATNINTDEYLFTFYETATTNTRALRVSNFEGGLKKLSFRGGAGCDNYGTYVLTEGIWYHAAIIYNGTEINVYLNGNTTPVFNCADTRDLNVLDMYMGQWFGAGTVGFKGVLDDIGIWNRTLNSTEVNGLYNNGNGVSWIPQNIGTIPPAVTLNYPANAYSSTNNTIIFNCSGINNGGGGILALTLIIDGSDNYTLVNSTSNSNISLQISRDLTESIHNWTCRVADSVDSRTADIRTLTIDKSAPIIKLNYPNSSNQVINAHTNVPFNFTITEPGLPISACGYSIDSGPNISLDSSCFNKTSVTNISLFNVTNAKHQLVFFANDSLGTMGYSSLDFYSYNYSLVYSPIVVEGELNNFYLNLDTTNLTSSSVNLSFNNTNYLMSFIVNNGTTYIFNRAIQAPLVSSDTIKAFNVTYNINGYSFSLLNINQTILNIPPLNISSTECIGKMIYYFDLQDEENLTSLIGDIEYNFYYGLSNSSLVRTYGKITNTNNLSICLNNTISPSWIIGKGEIFYNSPGYVDRRYYIFDNTNVSSLENITLYDLLSASQTSFKLEIEDTSLTPYKNIYGKLLRWYPDLNEYKIVDIGKTDETGSTVTHVRTEDVDYRIGAYYTNGTLIYLANPIRMVCLASPCTYTLRISPGSIDYTSFLNLIYTFTFNETTGIWLFTYSDINGKTDTINLTVWKDTSTSSYVICTNSITGSVGSLSCNTSLYSGDLRAEVYRTSSPPVLVVQKIVSIVSSAFRGSEWGLWLSMLIALPIIFLLVLVSPIAAIIGGIISLLPALYLGSINMGIVGGFAILGGIVAHFLKRIS